MAESGEGEEIVPRGNDWEVVSLTASAYAAAPGPKTVEEIVCGEESGSDENKAETSQAMFMSGHFMFPVKKPVDVPVGSEVDKSAIPKEYEIKELESLHTGDESGQSVEKDEDIKDMGIPDEKLKGEVFEGTGIAIGTRSAEVQRTANQPAVSILEPEQSINVLADVNADGPADVTSSKNVKDKKKSWSSVPCGPWWKRQAASLYDHVKEANPLWSIVIAAAVLGLAVLGQRWKQRKPLVSQLNLQFSAKEEKPGKMLGPMSRFKDAFVSSNHGSASVKGHISTQI